MLLHLVVAVELVVTAPFLEIQLVTQAAAVRTQMEVALKLEQLEQVALASKVEMDLEQAAVVVVEQVAQELPVTAQAMVHLAVQV